MNRVTSAMLGAAVCVAATAPAQATTVLRRASLDDLLTSSEFVFRGRVTRRETVRGSAQDPWTYYTFAIIDQIAGSVGGQTFSLRCFGGEVDGVRTEAVGAPAFRVGDDLIIFFDEDNQLCQVASWEQGAFSIVRSPSGESVIVDSRQRLIHGVGEKGLRTGGRASWLPPLPGERARILQDSSNPIKPLTEAPDAKPEPLMDILSDLKAFASSRPKTFGKVPATRTPYGRPLATTAVAAPPQQAPANDNRETTP